MARVGPLEEVIVKAEGSAGAAVTATRGVDLPTEPFRRPADWPERTVRNRTWTSPIAPPSDEAATRRAERDASDAAVREDRAKPVEVAQLVDAGLARMTPAALEEAARARAERVAARLAALEQESDQRAAEAEAALQARIEARDARNADARRRISQARAEQAARAAADRAAMADDLRRLYTAGDSLASIADTLGVSVAQVNRMRKEFDIERRRPALDREECVRLYAEHRSLERVAELLGTVPPAVRYHLAKAGVQTRTPGDNGARTPDDVRSKAVAMYEAGVPPVQITTELGISDSTLKRIRDAAGLAANPPGKHVPPTQRDSPAEIERRRRELLAAVRPNTSTERA